MEIESGSGEGGVKRKSGREHKHASLDKALQ